MEKIHTENYNVAGSFNNYYVVPDYQREYVWEEKHVNQLLEDINEEFSSNGESEYFIGSIVVCKNKDNTFDVIDGQQRLTTSFLTLCAIKKKYKELGIDDSAIRSMLFNTRIDHEGKTVSQFKLTLQYEENTNILKSITESDIPEKEKLGSIKRIAEAYEYILRFLEANFKDEAELRKFVGYFLNRVKLIQIETPTISDALKIFETINERGVGLNPMDLLKNLMFIQIQKDQFEKLKSEWKKITELLEKNKEKPLRFLRYFIMANYLVKNKKGEEIVREDEIYDWITDAKNKAQCNYEEKPFEFVKFMQENAQAYINFLNGKDSDGNENVYLSNITKLSGSFRQHLIMLLAAKDIDDVLFNHFAKQIEVLVFYYVLTGEPTKEFERKFSKWAKEIKSINNKDNLNAFIKNNLLPEIERKQKDFRNDFMRLDEWDLQKYRIRYILARIAQYIDNYFMGSTEEKNLDKYITKGVEIEHILPDTPTAQIKEEFGEDYTDYKILLGNLTLLEKSINIVIGNNFFESKKAGYNKSQFYMTRSIAEISEIGKNTSVTRINANLKSFDIWNKASIEERQKMLFELAKKIWKIKEIE